VSDPIKKGARPNGSTFYWFRISAGRHPVTCKRVQVYKSFPTKREAKAEYGKILSDLAGKRFVARDGITVNAYLDDWEPAHGPAGRPGGSQGRAGRAEQRRVATGQRGSLMCNRRAIRPLSNGLGTRTDN
jgi:hypothetical protein